MQDNTNPINPTNPTDTTVATPTSIPTPTNIPTDIQTNPVVEPVVEPVAQPEVEAINVVDIPENNLTGLIPDNSPVTDTTIDQAAQPVVIKAPVVNPIMESIVPPTQEEVVTPPNIDISALPETPVAEVIPVVTPNAEPSNVHENTAALNVLDDIMPEKPTFPMTSAIPSTPEVVVNTPIDVLNTPTDVADSGANTFAASTSVEMPQSSELSEVFKLTPSEVEIPSNTAPVGPIYDQGPVLVPTETPVVTNTNESGFATNQVPSMATTPAPVISVKGGSSGSLLKIVLWGVILVIGIIALIIGMYFANIIKLPFLDTIFG